MTPIKVKKDLSMFQTGKVLTINVQELANYQLSLYQSGKFFLHFMNKIMFQKHYMTTDIEA